MLLTTLIKYQVPKRKTTGKAFHHKIVKTWKKNSYKTFSILFLKKVLN